MYRDNVSNPESLPQCADEPYNSIISKVVKEIKTQLFCSTSRMTLGKIQDIFCWCFRIQLIAVGLVDTPYDAVYSIHFHFYWKAFFKKKDNKNQTNPNPTFKNPFVWKEGAELNSLNSSIFEWYLEFFALTYRVFWLAWPVDFPETELCRWSNFTSEVKCVGKMQFL